MTLTLYMRVSHQFVRSSAHIGLDYAYDPENLLNVGLLIVHALVLSFHAIQVQKIRRNKIVGVLEAYDPKSEALVPWKSRFDWTLLE